MKKFFILFSGAFLFVTQALAYPQPSGFVSDFANILDNQTKQNLEQTLRDFEKQTSHEIAIATLPSLEDRTIEEVANELFRKWGVGKKSANNGVLFLVAPNERRMRIEVGLGLEGALTDLESFYIQEEIATPLFREGKFSEGTTKVALAIANGIREEIVPASYEKKGGSGGSGNFNAGNIIFLLYFGIWIAGSIIAWLGSILARSKSWWAGGVIGAIIGGAIWFFFGMWFFTIIFAILGTALDYKISKEYALHGEKSKWWAGGKRGFWFFWPGGRGGGGLGGGFGGFGGGFSGGGGASGRW